MISFAPFISLPDLPAIVELRSYDQWVAWRYKEEPGRLKPTKPPVSPVSGFGASHSDPKTWTGWERAEQYARERHLPGVGFVISQTDPFSGIDLDNCIGADGSFAHWAVEIIELAETYAEISPSGKGIRLFVRGKIEKAIKSDTAGIELYCEKLNLTATGKHIAATPR